MSYTSHSPIEVFSDSGLAAAAVSGMGTKSDPYLLQGWEIITNSVHGIYIHDTTKYFIIRNCYINTGRTGSYGIYIRDAAFGTATIVNNTCYNNYNGIFICDSANLTIMHNNCQNNTSGIKILKSTNSTITHNTCYNNYQSILVWESVNSIITNNTCQNATDIGIKLFLSWNSIIYRNNCSKNNIYLHDSNSSTIANNSLIESGLHIRESSLEKYLSYSVANNWVNKQPLGWLMNKHNINIQTTYGQLFLINCTNIQVKNQNYSHTATGITLDFCTSCRILNNTVCGNNKVSISITHSSSIIIANNTCHNNREGIYISDVNSTIIANNTCRNNRQGVCILGTSSAIISNNTCNQNWVYGIYINKSKNCSLTNNVCNRNNIGFVLWDSENCSLIWNLIAKNREYGVKLHISNNNLLHHNTFCYNGWEYDNKSQAFDDKLTNQWHEEIFQEGNYWSNYEGISNYSIEGSVGVVDLYPLEKSLHTNPPVFDHPQDILYEEGTAGHQIIWNPIAILPSNYEIYRNNSLLQNNTWNGDLIVFSVDGLPVNTYNFTIVVYDQRSNQDKDTVLVEVIADIIAPTINPCGNITYQEGSIGYMIFWYPSDNNSAYYEIYCNKTLVNTTTWNGEPVTYSVDGLRVGIHNITIVVYDGGGNTAIDTVIVIVTLVKPLNTTSEPQATTSLTSSELAQSTSEETKDKIGIQLPSTWFFAFVGIFMVGIGALLLRNSERYQDFDK